MLETHLIFVWFSRTSWTSKFSSSLCVCMCVSICMLENWVRFLGWEDPLEKEMVTHCSILAWRIPWTEEPGRLQSTGSRVWHDLALSFLLSFCMCVCDLSTYRIMKKWKLLFPLKVGCLSFFQLVNVLFRIFSAVLNRSGNRHPSKDLSLAPSL